MNKDNSIGSQIKSKNITNNLWDYADLANFLQVSVNKLRQDVMNRKIPFIKVGRLVRFDKNQIADFLKIKITEAEVIINNVTKETQPTTFENDIATWLLEKSKLYKYGEINIKLIMHDGRISLIEKTIVEKIKK